MFFSEEKNQKSSDFLRGSLDAASALPQKRRHQYAAA
jgi:hypothetical protein